MRFRKKDPEVDSIKKIRSGVTEFEKALDFKEKELSELFVSLKEDILTSEQLDMRHVRILKKQVRHILSVARAIHYPELEEIFEKEEKVLSEVESLLEEFPGIDVSSSGDLQASMKNLQSMLSMQQKLIFRHKEIMSQEKKRLIEILREAGELEQEVSEERSIRPDSSTGILH